MSAPRVSIALPFYNAEATLDRSLGSLQRQTFTDWECIAVDDGSADRSVSIVERYEKVDPRFHLVRTERRGIVKALNTACKAARSPYIARMDADDTSHEDRLRLQYEFMEQRPDIALCGTEVVMAGNVGEGRKRYETWINSLKSHNEILREIFVECPIPHPTFFIRNESLRAAGGYLETGGPEDYDLIFRLWRLGFRFAKVEGPLLAWYDTAGRLSMTDDRYTEQAFRAMKRRYLFQTFLQGRPRFFQWGAGEVGKRWLREWGAQKPLAVVDIRKGKIGQTIHGTTVIRPAELPAPGEAKTIAAVGTPGARETIRGWLNERGYRETYDYVFVA